MNSSKKLPKERPKSKSAESNFIINTICDTVENCCTEICNKIEDGNKEIKDILLQILDVLKNQKKEQKSEITVSSKNSNISQTVINGSNKSDNLNIKKKVRKADKKKFKSFKGNPFKLSEYTEFTQKIKNRGKISTKKLEFNYGNSKIINNNKYKNLKAQFSLYSIL